MALLNGKQIRDGSIPASKLAAGLAGSKPTALNKNISALVTTADGQVATAPVGGLLATPVAGSFVAVVVNGQQQVLGDADKTHDCYFSSNGGVAALAISSLASGSLLYWNGSVAGFQLDTTDRIDLNYSV